MKEVGPPPPAITNAEYKKIKDQISNIDKIVEHFEDNTD
jgi:hypothetical protein